MKITTEKEYWATIGSYVQVTDREGIKFEGLVAYLWQCLDELAIAVKLPSGEERSALPFMGDVVEVVRTREEQAAR